MSGGDTHGSGINWLAVAMWEPGDAGGDVVGRARLGLELRTVGPA